MKMRDSIAISSMTINMWKVIALRQKGGKTIPNGLSSVGRSELRA